MISSGDFRVQLEEKLILKNAKFNFLNECKKSKKIFSDSFDSNHN